MTRQWLGTVVAGRRYALEVTDDWDVEWTEDAHPPEVRIAGAADACLDAIEAWAQAAARRAP